MKKTLLSAAAFAVAGVSAVAIMPTTSEAIPAFARQTGAACLSCHFQTFPAVNAFGRSFKLNAFTDVGEQALVEDEGLSLPSVLNASFVLRAQYTLAKTTTALGVTSSARTWGIPADAVMLIAGRVAPTTGAFVEFAGGAANWQLMNSFDLDGLKVGLNIANTGFGVTSALETTNVYGQHGGKLNGKAVSAVETIITGGVKANAVLSGIGANGGNTTSVALWTGNDSFTVQGTLVALADAAGAASPNLLPMLRGTYVADLGGAEMLIGAGLLAGTQSTAAAATGADAKWVDLQIQGEMGDASYGVYADWVNTKAKAVGGALVGSNAFANNANSKRDGFGIRGEVKPLHHVMFGIGYLSDKTTTAGAATKTTTTQLAATYAGFQNMEINTWYSNANTSGGSSVKTYFAEVEALM